LIVVPKAVLMLGYVPVGEVLLVSALLGVSVFFEQETAPKIISPMRAAIVVNLFII
jgi:hypothetical protein